MNSPKRKVPKLSGLVSLGIVRELPASDVEHMPTLGEKSNIPDAVDQADGISVNVDTTTKESAQFHVPPTEVSTNGSFKVSIGQLKASPFNVRNIRTDERIQEIGTSLLADGQREPITVYPGLGEDNGQYLIVSGVTRHLAAKAIGWTELEARIDTKIDSSDPLSIVRISHLHNDAAPETDIDHAIVAKQLKDKKFSMAQIAAALSYKSERHASRLMAFFDLPSSLLELGKRAPSKFTAHFAEAFRSAVNEIGEGAALVILEQTIKDDLSLKNIEQLVAAEKRRKARGDKSRKRSTRDFKQPVIAGGKEVGSMSVLQMSPTHKKVQLSAVVDSNVAALLSERLESLIKSFAEETSGE